MVIHYKKKACQIPVSHLCYTPVITRKKNDPMMLLMAAAEVVNQQSKQTEQGKLEI